MAVRRITKQVVDSSLADGRDYFIWDSDVKGFGLKVSPSAKKTYIVESHIGRKSRTQASVYDWTTWITMDRRSRPR